MDTMDGLRGRIDDLDAQIVELLDKRAEIAAEIGEWKRQEGRPAFDGVRQRTLLDKLMERGHGKFPQEGLRNVFTEIMSACRNLEEAARIAFLGPEATFTHQAAVEEFGSSGEFLACDKIPDIFEAVEKGRAHYGVTPIENSTGGVVYETLDRFMQSPLRICAERTTPIQMHLMSNSALADVDVVFSHPQPFAQCREWLQARLPNARYEEVSSTVRGAELAAQTPRSAAIGPEMAAKKTRLKILERGIQDMGDNVTRFWIIGRDTPRRTGKDKTSILFFLKDRPGALFHALKPISENNINLTKIESRPSRRGRWQYAFFVDFLGHAEDETVKASLKELETHCEQVRILGSYPLDKNAP